MFKDVRFLAMYIFLTIRHSYPEEKGLTVQSCVDFEVFDKAEMLQSTRLKKLRITAYLVIVGKFTSE